MQPPCPLLRVDCPLREISRERATEVIEEVIYVEQKIKKFDREGSETIELAKMPEFVEREIEYHMVTFGCDACGHRSVIRDEYAAGT
jgi:hypothetical protein